MSPPVNRYYPPFQLMRFSLPTFPHPLLSSLIFPLGYRFVEFSIKFPRVGVPRRKLSSTTSITRTPCTTPQSAITAGTRLVTSHLAKSERRDASTVDIRGVPIRPRDELSAWSEV